MRLVEHRCLFQIRLSSVFDIAAMLDPESILEIAFNPHLSDNVTVLWHICTRNEFDEEARGCIFIRWMSSCSNVRRTKRDSDRDNN